MCLCRDRASCYLRSRTGDVRHVLPRTALQYLLRARARNPFRFPVCLLKQTEDCTAPIWYWNFVWNAYWYGMHSIEHCGLHFCIQGFFWGYRAEKYGRKEELTGDYSVTCALSAVLCTQLNKRTCLFVRLPTKIGEKICAYDRVLTLLLVSKQQNNPSAFVQSIRSFAHRSLRQTYRTHNKFIPRVVLFLEHISEMETKLLRNYRWSVISSASLRKTTLLWKLLTFVVWNERRNEGVKIWTSNPKSAEEGKWRDCAALCWEIASSPWWWSWSMSSPGRSLTASDTTWPCYPQPGLVRGRLHPRKEVPCASSDSRAFPVSRSSHFS